MKNLLLVLISSSSFYAFNQTNHNINTMGNSWAPNSLTIDVGDSITFTNAGQGLHNVNGTTATYPSNPESFGMLTSSQNWVYGHRFNIAGTYSYRCDVHSSMMTGTIVVNGGAGLVENDGKFGLYPNPVKNLMTLKVNHSNYTASIYDMMGNLIFMKEMNNENVLDLSQLMAGSYLVQINAEGTIETQRFMKK